MNLAKFIDNRFQELRVKEQEDEKKKTYSLTRDAEVMALQSVLKAARVSIKWVMTLKVIGEYLAVLVGFKAEPRPVILEKLKADLAAKEAGRKMAEEIAGNVTSIQKQEPPLESPA